MPEVADCRSEIKFAIIKFQAFEYVHNKLAPPATVKKNLCELALTADRLHTLTRLQDTAVALCAANSDQARLSNLTGELRWLAEWVRLVAKIIPDGSTGQKPDNRRELVAQLDEILFEATRRHLSTSYNRSDRDFVKACLEIAGIAGVKKDGATEAIKVLTRSRLAAEKSRTKKKIRPRLAKLASHSAPNFDSDIS
jgi:hypothetical protein